MPSSHKGEARSRANPRRPERKWVTKPLESIRPVADPEATCVICAETGADWYGGNGDAVHAVCWRKKLNLVGKGYK